MQYALQKAVTALIDNSQRTQSNVLLRKGRPLKSISDQLKGKEGRFRQHLLGKRVDYSARSVIIVGPTLKLYECGIPLIMALKLFQPFLIIYLINRFKIASLLATQLIQQKHAIVINILKKFIETWPILLNRAPTLHRMNIQSFKMKLVEGKAILLHPLVCSSFNADFDGDQMGVHVPITQQARAEAWKLLWSINNSIGLASRQPLFLPTQDMVIGNFYLTRDALPYYQNNIMPGHQSEIGARRVFDHNSGNCSLDLKSLPYAIKKSNKKAHQYNIANGEAKRPNSRGPRSLIGAPSNLDVRLLPKKLHVEETLVTFSELSNEVLPRRAEINWQFSGVQRGVEEAYQYYLKQSYQLHINTPCWFYSFLRGLGQRSEPGGFEISDREKAIEIFIDKQGYSTYLSNYYEMKFKRNRFLIMNQRYVLRDRGPQGDFQSTFSHSAFKHSDKRKNIELRPSIKKRNEGHFNIDSFDSNDLILSNGYSN